MTIDPPDLPTSSPPLGRYVPPNVRDRAVVAYRVVVHVEERVERDAASNAAADIVVVPVETVVSAFAAPVVERRD